MCKINCYKIIKNNPKYKANEEILKMRWLCKKFRSVYDDHRYAGKDMEIPLSCSWKWFCRFTSVHFSRFWCSRALHTFILCKSVQSMKNVATEGHSWAWRRTFFFIDILLQLGLDIYLLNYSLKMILLWIFYSTGRRSSSS